MLDLIRILTERLAEEGIAYCHWKSNEAIDRTYAGDNDLDLLVNEAQRERFEDILADLGYRRAVAWNESWFPGIVNYYGLDRKSGLLVHVHAHYRLVLGYDMIKNYVLPIEDAYIASATRDPDGGLPLPSPAMELMVFVLRMVLKRRLLTLLLHHPRDWRPVLAGRGRGALTGSEGRELSWLLERADLAQVRELLETHLPMVSRDLFSACLDSIREPVSAWGWLRAGNDLEAALSGCARLPRRAADLTALARRLAGFGRRLTGRSETRKRFSAGGRLVAVVGGDGAGKTTNLEALRVWLGATFVVRMLHFGKPRRGVERLLLGLILRIIRPGRGGRAEDLPPVLEATGFLFLALDRRRLFRRARAAAARGEIVILDRFRVAGLDMMDSPQIGNIAGANRLLRWMAAEEERIYGSLGEPDELIVLRLPPEVAVERKPEDGAEYVRRRNRQLWDIDWDARRARVLDAAEPLESVKTRVRGIVWSGIRRRARLVEVVGPPGSGKSTALAPLRERWGDMRTEISARRHPGPWLRSFAATLPILLSRRYGPLNMEAARAVVYLETIAGLFRRSRTRCDHPHRGLLVLDEGPLGGLVWLRHYAARRQLTPEFDAWWDRMAATLGSELDLVIFIDAPDAVLRERINMRVDRHRIKNAEPDRAREFIANTRDTLERVLSEAVPEHRVHRIDSSRSTPEEITRLIAERVS